MNKSSSFFKNILRKPPFLFPWVAFFHFLMLCYSVWLNHDTSPLAKDWLPTWWMVAYTALWLMVCDLRKWAAVAYVCVNALDLVLYFVLKEDIDKTLYTSPLIFIAIPFSFFIFYFFRKFE